MGCKSEISGGVADAGDAPDGSTVLPMPDAAPLPDAQSAPCVEGDVQGVNTDNGNCYWVTHSTTQDWTTARQTCENAGGWLVTITSEAESDFVNALVIQAWQDTGGADAVGEVEDYVLGATDQPPSAEGTFVWVTGEDFTVFNNWRQDPLEPNDGNGNGEDCSIIEADRGGTWDDRPCLGTLYGYVCERE